MGDKTQLATVSLAIEFQNIFQVLAGTTAGMIIADAVGIGAGVMLYKHVPEKKVKLISAGIFILFGLFGVYNILSARLSVTITFAVLAVHCSEYHEAEKFFRKTSE